MKTENCFTGSAATGVAVSDIRDKGQGRPVATGGQCCRDAGGLELSRAPVHGRPMPTRDPHLVTMQRAQASARLVLRGIGLNAVLALLKFSGGFFGHTYALIAEGAASLLDILSSLLVWAGFRVAGQPPDVDHPDGHGKAEPPAALGAAGVGFAMAGRGGWRGVHRVIAAAR